LVERSQNGSNFSVLGRIAASGTSNSIRDYIFIDQHPLKGLNYYRLKQYDSDGKYSYSRVRTANFASSILISVAPNPTTQYVQVSFSHSGTFSYRLFTMDGTMLLNDRVANSTVTIDMKKFPSGSYILETYDGSKKEKTFKILKN
jgi:hypothetical protein